MRENRLKILLDAGAPLFGAMLEFTTPRQVEFIGHLGFDWVMIDAEHDGLTIDQAYQLVLAADHVGLGTMVRVPVNRPEVLLGFAETGVNCILSPHIMSGESARQLVSSLTFPPAGTRGLGAGSRAANFGLTQSPSEYFAATGTHVMPAALLEDVEAFDGLDEILAVEGLQVCALGPGDLAGSLGHPGRSDHPDVARRIAEAAEKVKASGKILNVAVGTAAAARDAAASGARLIAVSANGLVKRAALEYLGEVRG